MPSYQNIDDAQADAQMVRPLTPTTARALATLIRACCLRPIGVLVMGGHDAHIRCLHPGGVEYVLPTLAHVADYLKEYRDK